MRERLRIGEVSKLLGVTPKALRHYEKIGLLKEAERSESGYRLYSADDLLRLQRIKRLRSLGLSLKRVRAVLGEVDQDRSLREILKTLMAEVEAEMALLEDRRRRIEAMLSGEDPDQAEAPPSFEKAMSLLGDHLSGVSETALEQEKKFWSVLDAFEWPEGYDEENERLFRYYADHPEEYRELVAIGEHLAGISALPEDDPRVKVVAEELGDYFEKYPPPEELKYSQWAKEDAIGQTILDLTVSSMSPAQRRVMALIAERAEADEEEDAGS
jgi:DNA-binding transcriptional MerR regulator